MRPLLYSGILVAASAVIFAGQPATPARGLPTDAPGVYIWGAGIRDLPPGVPIKGVPLSLQWADVEPQRGHFAFDAEVRAPLERAARSGYYVHMMMWVAPKTPTWLYQIGVPRVEVPERTDPFRRQVKPSFPYYFSPIYKEHFHRVIHALGDYVAALPDDLKRRLIFVQVAEGSTGDGQPYKGVPLHTRYRITEEQWGAFRRETWGVYAAAFQRADGRLQVPLLVNGDANGETENAWLLEHGGTFGVKQGMFSHGYLVSDTIDRLARWDAFRAEAQRRGAVVFSRGEQDGEWKVCGWSAHNPPQAFYWSALFALHCKLDVWNVPSDAIASQPLAETVQLFNRYAGQNDAAGSRNAFCALHRALDASDTAMFPEAKFGPANKNNRARYLAIAAAEAPFGARQGDPDKALGGGMRNRQADEQNDVGWRILPGNFERHLTQLRPEETSRAVWDVEPKKHPYSRFARRFDVASGRTTMGFRIADGFFAAPGTASANLRVVYLDRGEGKWQLVYGTKSGERIAQTVTLTNSGEWKDIKVTLADAVWSHQLTGGADLALRHAGGGDTVFHLLELERR